MSRLSRAVRSARSSDLQARHAASGPSRNTACCPLRLKTSAFDALSPFVCCERPEVCACCITSSCARVFVTFKLGSKFDLHPRNCQMDTLQNAQRMRKVRVARVNLHTLPCALDNRNHRFSTCLCGVELSLPCPRWLAWASPVAFVWRLETVKDACMCRMAQNVGLLGPLRLPFCRTRTDAI